MGVTDGQTVMGITKGSVKKLTQKLGLEIRVFPKEMGPREKNS